MDCGSGSYRYSGNLLHTVICFNAVSAAFLLQTLLCFLVVHMPVKDRWKVRFCHCCHLSLVTRPSGRGEGGLGDGGRDAVEGGGGLRGGSRSGRQAVGGCQSGSGRLLSVTNAIKAGTCRQGDSDWA